MGGGITGFWKLGVAVAILGILLKGRSSLVRWDKEELVEMFRGVSDQLGIWAMPVYVMLHTITLALCLPYAVFFEAGASLLFGFFNAVLCVFSAKVLGASLSFWIGRIVFRSSKPAMEWVQTNKYFYLLLRGVERDGWRFVLLARFSPIPSYVINYALAATNVGFLLDFLLPTVIGSLPMILQNTSIGSLAGAAVASATGNKKAQVWSYIFPMLGILSSILISLRIKKYSSGVSMGSTPEVVNGCNGNQGSNRTLSGKQTEGLKSQ
ncbi:SNARE associated Golgi protein [Dillenia turbinata]|uniref:SNARE associated Golgi protein n=1 Tax=Dillenia turbinata TaxID=194707 RepID=A0AAN8ZMD9_9MAGN